jgi:hypothetical protein
MDYVASHSHRSSGGINHRAVPSPKAYGVHRSAHRFSLKFIALTHPAPSKLRFATTRTRSRRLVMSRLCSTSLTLLNIVPDRFD